MAKDYTNQNLQKASFKNEDLTDARFSNSDLRGADLSGSNLSGADFTNVKTGIVPSNTILIFTAALIVSLVSGYFAMLAGTTVQGMFASDDPKIRYAGTITIVVTILFILYAWWKGPGKAILNLILPVVLLAGVIGLIAFVSGLGTGRGMLYLIIALIFMAVMFMVGTIARAAAGTLSNILFLIVACSGGMFGRSVGGGIGTVIMAIACMQISKRALSGVGGFESVRKIALYATRKFGTSFRNSKLTEASFSESKIRNADFTNADVSSVNWGNSKKINCIANESGNTGLKNKHG